MSYKKFKPNDIIPDGAIDNPWNTFGSGANQGVVKIQSELIHK